MDDAQKAAVREIADRMLTMVEPEGYRIDADDAGFTVAIAGTVTAFHGPRTIAHAFEQLGAAIQARIAFERARDMIAAAPPEDGLLPLWLVSGSSILARWLTWSRNVKAFRRGLVLLGGAHGAPIAGDFEKRSRRELGQGGVRIRVRFGQAVAESIELSAEPKAIAVLGKRAHIRVMENALPETVIAAMGDDYPGRNDRERLVKLVSHPFLDAEDPDLIGIRNDGADAVFEIATTWEPLEPIPSAARAIVPRDADFVSPWRATAAEVSALYCLVGLGRSHGLV